MELSIAFALGLTGSLHCVGMCGPLMLAMGAGNGLPSALAYQTGRIGVYLLLGALLGGLGLGMQLWNAQSTVALVSGGMLVTFAVLRLDPGKLLARQPWFARFQLRLRSVASTFAAQGGLRAKLILGACNGLLPCGLVYLAVIAAANAGSPGKGAAFMLAFGLGTLPLLLGSLLLGRRIVRLGPDRLAAITPYVIGLAGLLLLWRGWTAYVPNDFHNFQQLAFPPMCH